MTTETHPTHENAIPHYRKDIDGLRAVSILLVILFHAFPSTLKGGFVGVDVFFVISGYLISGILFSNLASGRINFIDFYQRRIKRIFPALVLVLVSCYVFAWGTMRPEEFKQLGLHMAAGAGFSQNLVLLSESGYFDTKTELKPLMHLWSLAIEEQFYLVYPVMLLIGTRFRIKTLNVLLVLFLASFCINLQLFHQDTSRDFYLPYTRFWELLAGGVLAHMNFKRGANLRTPASPAPQPRWLDMVSVAGLALILTAACAIANGEGYPGYKAILPVAGACCIIMAGPQALVNRLLLSHPIMLTMGLISYPLYLWHWPLLSFPRLLLGFTPSESARWVLLAISIALAWLTYRFIESPVRFRFRSNTAAWMLLAFMTVTGLIGFNTYLREGLPFRPVAKIKSVLDNSKMSFDESHLRVGCGLSAEDTPKFLLCKHDGRGESKFALIGDSKALALASGVLSQSNQKGYWMAIAGHGVAGPVSLVSESPRHSRNPELVKTTIASLKADPHLQVVVITVATRVLFDLANDHTIEDLPENKNYPDAWKGLDHLVGEMVGGGKKVVLTVDNPTLLAPADCMTRETAYAWVNGLIPQTPREGCTITLQRHLDLSTQYRKLLESVKSKYSGKVFIFDTLPVLCGQQVCPSVANGKALYGFTDHISAFAAHEIGQRLVPYVEGIAAQSN